METILEALLKLFIRAGCWRTLLCLSLGTAIGIVAHGHIPADPLRWIVAGTIVFLSLLLGLKWEDYRTEIH